MLIHATMWMNLENIMLNEKKPDTKGHILYDPIYMKYPEETPIETESTTVVPKGWEEVAMRVTASSPRVFVWSEKKCFGSRQR